VWTGLVALFAILFVATDHTYKAAGGTDVDGSDDSDDFDDADSGSDGHNGSATVKQSSGRGKSGAASDGGEGRLRPTALGSSGDRNGSSTASSSSNHHRRHHSSNSYSSSHNTDGLNSSLDVPGIHVAEAEDETRSGISRIGKQRVSFGRGRSPNSTSSFVGLLVCWVVGLVDCWIVGLLVSRILFFYYLAIFVLLCV
jgi:hypothetical protein